MKIRNKLFLLIAEIGFLLCAMFAGSKMRIFIQNDNGGQQFIVTMFWCACIVFALLCGFMALDSLGVHKPSEVIHRNIMATVSSSCFFFLFGISNGLIWESKLFDVWITPWVLCLFICFFPIIVVMKDSLIDVTNQKLEKET